jgi:hypothetical protein
METSLVNCLKEPIYSKSSNRIDSPAIEHPAPIETSGFFLFVYTDN